jgi:chitinase
VCYFSSWAVYRNGDGKFEASNIDPFLCSHIIYGFIGTNPDGSVKLIDSWNDINLGKFENMRKLHKENIYTKYIFEIYCN